MSVDAVEIVGGGLPALQRAVTLTREGRRVVLVEPELRAGGRWVTESFLTPFRFNLGPALVPRSLVGDVEVIEPDPLLAVGGATLGRAPIALAARDTVWETLEASRLTEPPSALLAGLAVLLGLDPDLPESGASLAHAVRELPDLVAVLAGNGAVAARLLDELVAGGGRVLEAVGPQRHPDEPPATRSLGTCRLFFGLRGRRPEAAFATGLGFAGADDLRSALDAMRDGSAARPLGFLVENAHLDPACPGDPLTSLVWQGVLPAAAPVSRSEYTAAVLAAAGIEPASVLFALAWLPAETNEPLAGTPTALRA